MPDWPTAPAQETRVLVTGAAGAVDTIHRAETFSRAEFRRDVEANLVDQFTVAQAVYPPGRYAAAKVCSC